MLLFGRAEGNTPTRLAPPPVARYRNIGQEAAMALTLVIGNKNYSSWSFRPWIAMKTHGIAFVERVISLDDPQFKPTLLALSPAGKVPVLLDGATHVWESLAILE